MELLQLCGLKSWQKRICSSVFLFSNGYASHMWCWLMNEQNTTLKFLLQINQCFCPSWMLFINPHDIFPFQCTAALRSTSGSLEHAIAMCHGPGTFLRWKRQRSLHPIVIHSTSAVCIARAQTCSNTLGPVRDLFWTSSWGHRRKLRGPEAHRPLFRGHDVCRWRSVVTHRFILHNASDPYGFRRPVEHTVLCYLHLFDLFGTVWHMCFFLLRQNL